MKKKSSAYSAFFHVRAISALFLCVAGLVLGGLAAVKFHEGYPLSENSKDAEAEERGEPRRDMPTFDDDEKDEAASLGRLEQYWNDRLTYPTGHFNPAWVRRAAEQDAVLSRSIPAGSFARLNIENLKGKSRSQGVSPLALSTTSFTALGPAPERMTGCSGCYDYGTTAGRINDIVFDPTTTTNGTIVAYSASVGGGVWKTTNCCSSSTSWTVVTDDPLIATTSIDTLAIDPNDHNTIYAGTGDLNFGSFSMGSQGILKSTDAGATWKVLAPEVFGPDYPEPVGQFPQYNAVGKVRVDPNNSNNVLAGTKLGLYLSNDAGVTWTQCSTNNFTTQRQDITGLELTNVGGTTRVLAAIGTRGFATPVQYDLGNQGANGLYMATLTPSGCPTFSSIARNDNGFVFGPAVTGSPYAVGAPMNAGSGIPWSSATGGNQLSRMDIAVAPNNPSVIYAQVGSIAPNSSSGCGNANGCALGTWVSTNGGTTWTFMTGSAGGSLANCTGGAGSGDYNQNWYDQGVAVDPNNADRIIFNTFETWLATRTGTSWYDLTCGYNGTSVANHIVHVDHHAQAFVPGSSDILLIGDDGGIHGTTNASSAVIGTTRPTWFNMDTGMNTIEFYSGDISGNFATDSSPSAVGGAQDNGPSSVTFSGTPTGPVTWQMGLGGDGFSGQIDPVGTGQTQASGTIALTTGGAVAGETFQVGSQVFTFQAGARTGTGQVQLSSSTTTEGNNIAAAITADTATSMCTATRTGATVIVSANIPGPAGNSITFTENATNMTMNGNGTLGGTTQGGLPGGPRFWEGNNSGGLSRCIIACSQPGAVWQNRMGGWGSDTQSFVLPINLFRGGIAGGDDCGPAGPTTGCGHLVAGTTRVWETVSGATATNTWYVTNNPTTSNLTKQALGNRSYINQVKYSPKFQSVAIVGTNDGNVQIGFNLGTGTQAQANWVNVTGANTVLPNRPVLGIALDPTVPTADVPVGYASIGGFNANSPTTPGHLFRVACSSNCGSFVWQDKTGNLPDIPADSVIVNPVNPQQVFVGTDWGLYFTNDITQPTPVWSRFDSGLPHAMIWDMSIDRGSTTLSVWTRSRGAYVFPLPAGDLINAAPTLVSAASRMTHGQAGTFDLPLSLTSPATIEPRSNGNGDYNIVLTFNEAVNSGTATTNSGSVSNVSYSDNSMIVSLSGVANAQTITVTANNIAGPNTQTTSSASVNVGILFGDANSSSRTDAGDVALARQLSVSIPDGNTFRADVDLSGRIDAGDVTAIRQAAVTVLPSSAPEQTIRDVDKESTKVSPRK